MAAASAPLGTSGSVLGVAHPLYTQHRPIWQQLLDVYEGAGGFLDTKRPYLIAHSREYLDHTTVEKSDDGSVISATPNPSPTQPSPKLLERRKLARYENYAETLIDQLAAALFREDASRTFDDQAPKPTEGKRPIELFWDDADGMGTPWAELLNQLWVPAGVFGHVVLYFEQAPDDERTVPVVRAYTPLDVPDWLTDDRGRLTQIKLLEAAPRESFKQSTVTQAANTRVRVVTEVGWSLQDTSGKVLDLGEHGFEQLPVIVLYAKRRAITPFIGKSPLGDPMKFIDLYNLVSEERELLRKQTFSILNVPVGEQGSIDREQGLIGRQSGTGNILFTTQAANYIGADGENVTVYHASIDRLIRSIFRSAMLPWDTDSKDAEAEGSRRIKREDLNQQLAKFANELQRVDNFATDLVYQAFYGPAWKQWKANDGIAISWPDEFDTTPLEELLKQFTDAVHADLGETATKELKKRAARAALPNLTKSKLEAIDTEIDSMEVVTEEEKRQEAIQAGMDRMTAAVAG
jgi:hypothetical protein